MCFVDDIVEISVLRSKYEGGYWQVAGPTIGGNTLWCVEVVRWCLADCIGDPW